MLEIEVHPDPAMDENREGHGPEGRGNRRLASKSTPIEQGQDFDSSTGTRDREEMSELSDISTKKNCDYKITHRQHHDAWHDGATGNVLIVFRKREEHFRNFFSIYHGSGYRR